MSEEKTPDEEKIPNNNVLWHQSGINAKGEPFVQLIRGREVIAQMSVDEARDHGNTIIEAAEAAETDAFIFDWVCNVVGSGPQEAVGLLVDFRKYRVERTGKKHGATHPRDWVMPPEDKPEGEAE